MKQKKLSDAAQAKRNEVAREQKLDQLRRAIARGEHEVAASAAAVKKAGQAVRDASARYERAMAALAEAKGDYKRIESRESSGPQWVSDKDRASLVSVRAYNGIKNSGLAPNSASPEEMIAGLRDQPFDWERLMRTKNLGRLSYYEIVSALDGVVTTPAPPFKAHAGRGWR